MKFLIIYFYFLSQCRTGIQLSPDYCKKFNKTFDEQTQECGCYFGYYSLSNNKTCLKCSEKCLECYNEGDDKCTKCPPTKFQVLLNYEFLFGYCMDEDPCAKNLPYYQYDKEKYLCIKCQQNCIKCEKTYCLQCDEGYYYLYKNEYESECVQKKECEALSQVLIYEGRCFNCEQDYLCNICGKYEVTYKNQINSFMKFKCSKCQAGLFLKENQCLQCSDLCQECTGPLENECIQCAQNYNFSNFYQKCICDMPFCEICGDYPFKCQKCLDGIQMNKTTSICNCFIDYCIQCDPKNSKVCLKCEDQYLLESPQKCVYCPFQNCEKCQLQENLNKYFCLKCMFPFVISQQTHQCEQCQVDNCLQCSSDDSKVCEQCIQKYEIQEETKQCITQKCSIENCYLCEMKNHQKCEICERNYFLNSIFQCQQFNQNQATFSLDIKTNQEGYDLQIICSEEEFLLESNMDIQKLFQIYITSVYLYTWEIQEFDKNIIKIKIQMQQNCKNQDVIVQIKNFNFREINNFPSSQVQQKLPLFVLISQENFENIESSNKAAQLTSQTAKFSAITTTIVSNVYIIFSTLDVTAYIYFLQYVNVRYPTNFLQFQHFFKDFQFAFIPNLLLYFISEDFVQQAPSKFIQLSVDSYFLKNAGQSFTIIIGVLLVYLIIKALSLIKGIKLYYFVILQDYLRNKIDESWEYCGFLDLVNTVYMYVTFAAFTQFYDFSLDNYTNTSVWNYIFHSLFLFLVINFPFYIYFILYCNKNIALDESFLKKISALISGLKLVNEKDIQIEKQNSKDIYCKYCNVILYFRKLFYIIFIVYLHNYTIIQMACLSILNLLMIYYYFIIKPFTSSQENYKQGISEILLVCMQGTVCYFIPDEETQDENERINVGWILVGLSGVIIIINMINMVQESSISIKNIIFKALKGLYENILKKFCFWNQQKLETDKKSSNSINFMFSSHQKKSSNVEIEIKNINTMANLQTQENYVKTETNCCIQNPNILSSTKSERAQKIKQKNERKK